MIQSHIILTQTFIDKNQLSKLLAYDFFELNVPIGASLKNLSLDNPNSPKNSEIDKKWDYLQANKLVISADFQEKADFTENILDLYLVYSKPTLLFLGDLSQYSIPLQEGMLRFLEEPPENLLIIMFAKNKTEILPTISSRCQFHILQENYVIKNLDTELLDKVKKKLPAVGELVKKIIGLEIDFELLDLSKVEREEIDFWLWQISSYLRVYYKKNPSQKLAKLQMKILEAQKLNQENLQKKFAVWWLKT